VILLNDFEQIMSPQFPIYSKNITAALLSDAYWMHGCEALFLRQRKVLSACACSPIVKIVEVFKILKIANANSCVKWKIKSW